MALMVQAIGDLNRNIRAVVELTAVMTKLKTIGINKSYHVELYEGSRMIKTTKFETFVKRYDKKIFPLCQSYAYGKGSEKAKGKRQNVLKNLRIWSLPVAWWSCASCPCIVRPVPRLLPVLRLLLRPRLGPLKASASSAKRRSTASDGWRLAIRWGRVRLENPSAFVGRGFFLVSNVDGQRVATWTGVAAQPATVAGVVK